MTSSFFNWSRIEFSAGAAVAATSALLDSCALQLAALRDFRPWKSLIEFRSSSLGFGLAGSTMGADLGADFWMTGVAERSVGGGGGGGGGGAPTDG